MLLSFGELNIYFHVFRENVKYNLLEQDFMNSGVYGTTRLTRWRLAVLRVRIVHSKVRVYV